MTEEPSPAIVDLLSTSALAGDMSKEFLEDGLSTSEQPNRGQYSNEQFGVFAAQHGHPA